MPGGGVALSRHGTRLLVPGLAWLRQAVSELPQFLHRKSITVLSITKFGDGSDHLTTDRDCFASSIIMGREAHPSGRGFPSRISTFDGDKSCKSFMSVLQSASAAVVHPLLFKTSFSSKDVCMVLMFALTSLQVVSAQSNFSVASNAYDCSSNVKCLGSAHAYNWTDPRIQAGSLSLVDDPSRALSVGIAYYYEPIKFLDLSTRQSVSFNTSFTINTIPTVYNNSNNSTLYTYADGMTFVISADNSGTGGVGGSLGFYDEINILTFKAIVVEFDTFMNPEFKDISGNHVSIDFTSILPVAAANASDVNVTLRDEMPTFAWVEYSSATKQLEVRISHIDRRPTNPLVNHTVDLFDVVEEHMWVGFSSSTGIYFGNMYVAQWSFESYGISGPVSTGEKSGGSALGMIVGIAVAVPTVLLAGAVIALWKRSTFWKQLAKGYIEDDPMMQLDGVLQQFSYKQLSDATGGFNEESKLGQGGFGSVHRGVLPSSGTQVAVKKISSNSTQGEKEFMAEVCIISQLRHRNLIQILGWCKETAKENYLLVYELMPNGSLDKALFGPADSQTPSLTWDQRFNIVSGIAAALDYLHQGLAHKVIHRDVKASNVMLDENWDAKLGDFGLARLVDHRREAATTLMAGTYGYIAPEVAASGKFTDKADVFSFGAVVLEVACGRKALSGDVPDNQMVLVNWVWHQLSVGELLSTVDKRLDSDYDPYWMEVMLIIGLLCSHPNPLARPSMRHVVQVLAGDAPVPSIAASKPAYVSAENVDRDSLWAKIWEGSRSESGNEPSDATNGSTLDEDGNLDRVSLNRNEPSGLASS